ncbi:MAG: hypothetical protein QOH69_1436 [Actinomycetota bacterium]|jgi:hypothetical protein|nr:hypothetical protein [Actinomycetota bacterium]
MTKPRQHPRIATIISAVAALATVLALSACAPAVHKATGGAPNAHAGSGHGSGSVPAPKPLAAPVTRVTKTCAELVPAAALTTSVGIAVPVVTPPADLESDVTFTEDGALTCNWSDNYPNDRMLSSNHLVVWVLPDVPTASWNTATPTLVESGEAKTSLVAGDAYGWCNPGGSAGITCEVDTRVGTTWLSMEIESLSKPFTTSDAGLTHFAALINPMVAAAGNAGFVTEPRWKNPAATVTPTTCDAALPDSEIESAAGVTGVDSIGPDLFDQPSIAEFWGAETNIGEVACYLASGDQANAFFPMIVPGGSWAWALTQAADSAQPGYTTVPSLGTKAIEYTDENGTTLDWVRGGNLCRISVTLATPAKQAAVALVLATYMNTKIPG